MQNLIQRKLYMDVIKMEFIVSVTNIPWFSPYVSQNLPGYHENIYIFFTIFT